MTHQIIMHLASRQNYDEVRKFGDRPEEDMAKGYIPEALYLKTENWKALGEPLAIEMTINSIDPTTPDANPDNEGDTDG